MLDRIKKNDFSFLLDLSELDEIGQLRLTHGRLSPKLSSSSPGPPKEKQQRVDMEEDNDEDTDIAAMAQFHDLWKSLADRENYPLPHHVNNQLHHASGG